MNGSLQTVLQLQIQKRIITLEAYLNFWLNFLISLLPNVITFAMSIQELFCI